MAGAGLRQADSGLRSFRQPAIGQRSRLPAAYIFIARSSPRNRAGTVRELRSAIRLYKQLGFVETAPYYANPMPDVIYMKRAL